MGFESIRHLVIISELRIQNLVLEARVAELEHELLHARLDAAVDRAYRILNGGDR